MDSIFSALTLQKLVNFLPDRKDGASTEFDIIVYDGISAEETLRLVGATERVRQLFYLFTARNFIRIGNEVMRVAIKIQMVLKVHEEFGGEDRNWKIDFSFDAKTGL